MFLKKDNKDIVFFTTNEKMFNDVKNVFKQNKIPFEVGSFKERAITHYISVSPFYYKKAFKLAEETRKKYN